MVDAFVKSSAMPTRRHYNSKQLRLVGVIPAKAGIQREINKILDSRLRRELSRTLRSGMTSYLKVGIGQSVISTAGRNLVFLECYIVKISHIRSK